MFLSHVYNYYFAYYFFCLIFLAAFHQETFLYVVYDRGLRANFQNVLTFIRVPGMCFGS